MNPVAPEVCCGLPAYFNISSEAVRAATETLAVALGLKLIDPRHLYKNTQAGNKSRTSRCNVRLDTSLCNSRRTALPGACRWDMHPGHILRPHARYIEDTCAGFPVRFFHQLIPGSALFIRWRDRPWHHSTSPRSRMATTCPTPLHSPLTTHYLRLPQAPQPHTPPHAPHTPTPLATQICWGLPFCT